MGNNGMSMISLIFEIYHQNFLKLLHLSGGGRVCLKVYWSPFRVIWGN